MAIEPGVFRQVLGSYPTGVCVVTALSDTDRPLGLVVGSFTSVSLDPPLVGFLPGKFSRTWPLIEAVGHFCVNVLANDQEALCRQIAAPGPDKFAGIEYTLSGHGLPVLAGATTRIECALHAVQEAGDHWFVLGRVLSLDVLREASPMLFCKGRYGGFAEGPGS